MSRLLRGATFLALIGAIVVGIQYRVLAMGNYLADSCPPGTQECTCLQNLTYGPDWSMSGSCDFSSDPDPIARGEDYCDGVFNACNSECYNNYPAYVASWYESYGDPWDPYYSVETKESCWWGYPVDDYCAAGELASWTCTCTGFNWCIE